MSELTREQLIDKILLYSHSDRIPDGFENMPMSALQEFWETLMKEEMIHKLKIVGAYGYEVDYNEDMSKDEIKEIYISIMEKIKLESIKKGN